MKKLVTVFAGLALATPALAQEYREEITEVTTPQPESGFGISVNIGGGVTGFSGQTMRDLTSDAGGSWNARVSLGTRSFLGLDLQYAGTATSLNGFGNNELVNNNNNNDATLIGTGLEAAARINFMPKMMWTPYIFGGAGWEHYSITNTDNNDASLVAIGDNDTDNLAVFPLGAGVSYRDPSGLNVDVRGTYRLAQKSDNLRDEDGDQARLDTWEATGNVGFEF
jgi:opacity protein-like surface antigen